VGVGAATEVDVDVMWPGGKVQALGSLAANRRYRVRQGSAPVAVR